MKKYFVIFASIAILGMLAVYFIPNNDSTNEASASIGATSTSEPDTDNTANNTPAPANSASSPTQSATTSTATTLKDGTYTGDDVSTRFGNVQIAITVSSGKITNVDFLSLPEDDMHSAQISSQASPMLESQTLSAQSADIDGVSGATYTTQGYIESLQAAIDAAKA